MKLGVLTKNHLTGFFCLFFLYLCVLLSCFHFHASGWPLERSPKFLRNQRDMQETGKMLLTLSLANVVIKVFASSYFQIVLSNNIRAINYDERDPFLCTSCGFCKYAKFELTLSCHPCCSVEPINNEEDREKALKFVNVGLEKADQFYQQLSEHRQILETLVKKAIDAEKKSTQVVCNFILV